MAAIWVVGGSIELLSRHVSVKRASLSYVLVMEKELESENFYRQAGSFPAEF